MDTTMGSRSIAAAPFGWLAGLALWVLFLVVLPAPIAARVFLGAPLLIVPLLLASLPGRQMIAGYSTSHLGAAVCLPAGVLVAVSLALPVSPLAALVALPWILLTSVVGLAALRHGLPSLAGLFARRRVVDLATDGALGFLAIGGLFLLVDRLGVAVLGSGPPYTLLGAIHYHFAGFGLLGLLALLAARGVGGGRPTAWWVAGLSLIGGVSVTAVGLILESSPVNWLGVLLLAAGGLIVAWSFVTRASRGWRRAALVIAGVGLTAGLLMGVAWASAVLFTVPFIGMDLMVRTHGTLNAAAVVLAALALGLPGRDEGRRA